MRKKPAEIKAQFENVERQGLHNTAFAILANKESLGLSADIVEPAEKYLINLLHAAINDLAKKLNENNDD